MPQIKHDISINANIKTVHQALTTAQGLKSWFTSQAKGSGQLNTNWDLSFTDQPSFSWRILAMDDHHISWECLKGPGNSPGTQVEFVIKPISDDQTLLTISHRGWEEHDPKFDRCVEIWRELMNHLQRYCQTGNAQPTYC